MPSLCKFFRKSGNFFHRKFLSKENPLKALKRVVQRRRCTVDVEPPATPRESADEPATASADAVESPSVNDADPFSDLPESAVEKEKNNPLTPPDTDVDTITDEKAAVKTVTEDLVPGPPCAICQEPIGVARNNEGSGAVKVESMAALPCGHKFGHACLLQWLDQAAGQTCPLCRKLAKHRDCGHSVMPALADRGPPSLKKGDKLASRCQSCRKEGDPGNRLLKLQWQMKEARGLALVSMAQVPAQWAESRIELEWQMMGERVRSVRTSWDETLASAWLSSQEGRIAW
ncbi:hypothetical protein V493_03388 [Pseudogymnoascus sp. VKM F-4281 (FW-2241)]|nr:hypothetical protein V493_03388 [Pseudogymnoascus sp. VKM F-4281 (FW-2241)]